MKDVGGADKLPTARFFGATWPVRKAAQNDTLFGIFDPASPAHRAAQNDTLFGVENLPTARFFAPTVQTRPGSREKFFDRSGPVRKDAQNDTLIRTIRKLYTTEIGIRESTGKNDGKRIEAYLTYVGLGNGNPWCAAFICWVYGKAGVTNPRSGWSPALFPEARIIWSRSRGVINNLSLNIQHSSSISASSIKHSTLSIQHSAGSIKNSTSTIQNSTGPRAADIFGIWFQDKKRIAHCGFIDDWQEKYVITVEGNTNESGSREGDGVYRKRRLISTVYKVARWVG